MPGTVREVHQEVRIDLTDAPTLTNTIGRTRIPRGLRITYGARTDITRIDLVIEWEADAELWPPAPAHPATKEHPMNPTRIQRRRTKGWHAPDGAVYVGRGSRWGNPFTVDIYVKAGRIGYLDQAEGRRLAASDFRQWLVDNDHGLWCGPRSESDAARDALLAALPQLGGRDLMCWCPLPEPGQPDHCHAAVLLQLANHATPAPVAR